ncbi:MAG: hypothetical protein DIU71_00305 [Proteobacteria bacterium]|nr:MAG: hypothetical protein DIU71_00305 [Pseudomonadota bacterium]
MTTRLCETAPEAHATAQPAPAGRGPVFIVGMPRSGTKLLRGLLAQHPRVRVAAAETEFLPFLAGWVERHGPPVSEQAFSDLQAAMHHATYFHYRSRAAGAFDWRRWRACCAGHYDVGGLFDGFMRCELDIGTGSDVRWVDKSPAYIRHVPLILNAFAEVRIIHLVRDVRDYCVSMRKAWNKDIRRAAWLWGRDVLDAHGHCTAHPERCIEVRYEDLLEDPEGQMRRLCMFLDLEYLPALTRLAHNVENRGDAKGSVEIVRDNHGKFTSRLTVREITDVEALAWRAMHAVGYTPLHAGGPRRLGTLAQRWLRIRDGLRLIAGDTQRFGLLGSVRFHLNHRRMVGR